VPDDLGGSIVLTVTTWNVQNLFPAGSADGPATQQAYDDKLDALATTIGTLGADVLALQEIGDPACLGELLARVGGNWHTQVSGLPDHRHIRVGFASRRPITAHNEVTTFMTGLDPVQADDTGGTAVAPSRGFLSITVDVPGIGDLHLTAAHLKSKLLSYPGGRFQPRDEDERARFGAYALYRRTAEATTLRAHVTELLAGAGQVTPAIVLGDLNDDPQAATTQILLGPPGSEIGTRGESISDQGDRSRLFNLAPKLPVEQQYSRIYRGRRELIDHILVSHALLNSILNVQSGSGLAAGPDLRSLGDNPHITNTRTGSDHSPITARFTT
jgi:endonuclease/exonuclease/phosphatase family metal-dependent hydrolase